MNDVSGQVCASCGNFTDVKANFCGTCGNRIQQAVGINPSNSLYTSLAYFFAVLLMNVVIYYAVDFYTFSTEVITSVVFIMITMLFALILKAPLKGYFEKSLKLSLVLFAILIAVALSLVVTYIADALNMLFWEMEYLEIDTYLETSNPWLYAMIFSCAVPALFEEIAFRGFIFGEIEKQLNTESALIISSILFAVLHLSAIGLIWYIPLGFLLGYVRKRYKSISYCVIIHFFYNLMIVSLDFHKYFTTW